MDEQRKKRKTEICTGHHQNRAAAGPARGFTLIELLVESACFSGDSAVDQGMRYERGEMR